MNFIASIKSKIKARKRSYEARVTNKVREKTYGKAQARMYQAEQRVDDRVWSAQDRALGEKQGTPASSQPQTAPPQHHRHQHGWSNAPQQHRQGPSYPAPAVAPAPPRPISPQGEQETECATRAVDLAALGLVEKRRFVKGWLVVQNGPDRGRDLKLYAGKNTLGCAANCDEVLNDPYVSPRHSIITIDDENRVTLVDLDSRHGVYLNGRRISREEVIDNDTLKFGRTEVKLYTLY